MGRYSLLQSAEMDYFTRQALDSCIACAIRSPHTLFSYNGGDLDLSALRAHGLGISIRDISVVESWLDVYLDIDQGHLGFVDVAYRSRRGMAIIQIAEGLKLPGGPYGALPVTGRSYFSVNFGLAF